MQSDFPALALVRLAEILQSCEACFVVGGSTGLALRGASLERAPRDIDVYVDKDAIFQIHEKISDFALDVPSDNKTERYRSILSHYRIADTIIELVGNFRVNALQSVYTTEVANVLFPSSDKLGIERYSVAIVPLGHELIFNLLRERMDRAALVGQMINREPEKHIPLLRTLLQRNQLSKEVVAEVVRLVQAPLHLNERPQEEL